MIVVLSLTLVNTMVNTGDIQNDNKPTPDAQVAIQFNRLSESVCDRVFESLSKMCDNSKMTKGRFYCTTDNITLKLRQNDDSINVDIFVPMSMGDSLETVEIKRTFNTLVLAVTIATCEESYVTVRYTSEHSSKKTIISNIKESLILFGRN